MPAKAVFSIIAVALVLASPAVADIYKWVDNDGNIHFGERVPAEHEDQVKTVNLGKLEPDQDAVDEARKRNERIRNAAEATAESNARWDNVAEDARAQQATSVPSGPPPLPQRPTHKQKQERYEYELRRYRESMDCFAPYKNANGSTKAEAFEKCEVLSQPQRPH